MTVMRAISAALTATALSLPAAAQDSQCSTPQSPRSIDRQASPSPYNGTYSTSIVAEQTDPNVITYLPRAGVTSYTLSRCGQHYHFPIETPQGCPGEIPAPNEAAQEPQPGQWIEVHTVYASQVRPSGCDPETLACCEAGPFVVRAFSARVTAGGAQGPILPPTGRPLAEWTGSTTGREAVPNECKPEANWSFRLGCAFTVSQGQLRQFKHADPARPLQPAARLSRDLTLVPPASRVNYDAARDFSPSSNPNGVWQYGWMPATGGTFQMYTNRVPSPTLNRWNSQPSQDFWLSVYQNPSDTPHGESYWMVEPGAMILHPGPQNQKSVVRFTAPVPGNYQIAVNFSLIDRAAGIAPLSPVPAVDLRVVQGVTNLFSDALTKFPESKQFSRSIVLAQGNTVDVAVGFGSTSYGNDGTRVDVKITRNCPVNTSFFNSESCVETPSNANCCVCPDGTCYISVSPGYRQCKQ
ncbi:MAG TPA: hypothetical protein VF179_09605 [Thermoanaerobaculia bacterium]|nr:hypothetical protein [Thermoanaerobaculia bacterium]